MLFEEKLIFHPTRYPEGNWEPDLPAGYTLEDIYFNSGEHKLHGWFLTPDTIKYSGAVLMCHGNAGNITSRIDKALAIASCGIPVFLFDYRGYGRSDDAGITEKTIYEDADSAWRWLAAKYDKIVIHGISLGGGAATWLTIMQEPLGLSLESTFTSIPDMSQKVYPFIPKFLISTDFNNLERITEIRVPLQIFHGTHDQLIPHFMGLKLYEAAECEKEFISIEGAGHTDVLNFAADKYKKQFSKFFARVLVKV